MLGTIQREIQAADPNLPLVNVRTMSDVLTQAMWVPRTGAALLTLFGAMALILAVVGTYGVTAFFVTQRRREIGVRVALGATPANILFRVMRQTFIPTLVGVGLGLAASYFGAARREPPGWRGSHPRGGHWERRGGPRGRGGWHGGCGGTLPDAGR